MVHGLMVFASVLVASSFTVGAAITYGLDPSVLTLVRFLIAVLVLAPFIGIRYGFTLPPGKNVTSYALISGCIVGFFWCMFAALRYTTALHTSILFTLVPGISGVYSAVILRERLGWPRLAALIIAMAGSLWVIFRGDAGRMLALEINRGDLIFLAGCFLMGFYTPLVKRFHTNEPMAVMTFWILVTGVGWLLLLAGPQLTAVQWTVVASNVWLGIIYLAVFTTIITFYLSQYSTLRIGPTRVMAYSYLYPVFVVIIDWGLGNGLPPAAVLPGIVVVLSAMVVLQHGADPDAAGG